ncbi:MAG: hydrogen gas-evolving membrane-bound hydrogenase subunit E [Phycisphaeraceae bacterium]
MESVALLGLAVLAPLLTGLLTVLVPRQRLQPRVWCAAAGPAVSFGLVLYYLLTAGVASPADVAASAPLAWMPSLELNVAFLADGLGAFFALLVAGVGLLIVLYGRAYFGREADDLYRFYPTLGFFTTAMLGIVLADYTLLTLLFWELTSISSFLLIGWDRYDKKAVNLALQAFFTTGLGGMAMFGGVLLFGYETNFWRWSAILANSEELRAAIAGNGMVWGAFGLLMLGAMTKSAQWPWHYWLPGAMAAPTPVSAFLHSATMVKAGVFLAGRMLPVLGVLAIWPWLIVPIGALTMLLGAALALNQHDLKRIFAYTTVSQLGLFMTMYGLGAMEYHHAPNIDWDITQIASHAFYKAPLFIVAGALGHVLSRKLPNLHGAFHSQKAMCITMLAAAYALAALPGTINFQAKEFFLYAVWHAKETIGAWWIVLMVMTVLTAMFNMAIFVRLLTTLMGWRFGQKSLEEHEETDHHDEHHHEHGFWGVMLWVPGAILVLPQFVGGLAPGVWEIVFAPLETNLNYHEHIPTFWHAITHPSLPLYMSALAVALGAALGLSPVMRGAVVDVHDKVFPFMYRAAVDGGRHAFGTVQTGHLRHYLLFVLGAFLLAFTGAAMTGMARPETNMLERVVEVAPQVWEYWPGILVGLLVCLTAMSLPLTQNRVLRVLLLGAAGLTVVAMFLVYQAPDLALTQLTFEIISVLLFVLVLRLLPEPVPRPRPGRFWRLIFSALVGIAFGWLTLVAATSPMEDKAAPTMGQFYAQHSYEGTELTEGRGGGGDNIVNVILVDFRGFDTLGEITVLALAAMGVWSLVPALRQNRYQHRRSGRKEVV